MSSRMIVAALTADGWFEVARRGSHIQLKHQTEPGRVTIPHPRRDIPIGTLRSIERQAGLKLRRSCKYIASIHKEPESLYGVSFPDFPGCITAGETLEEAQSLAGEALAFHVEGLIEDGMRLPQPSSIDAVMGSSDQRNGVAILVSLWLPADRVVHVDIVLAEREAETVDRYASKLGLSRAAILVRAAKQIAEDAA